MMERVLSWVGSGWSGKWCLMPHNDLRHWAALERSHYI